MRHEKPTENRVKPPLPPLTNNGDFPRMQKIFHYPKFCHTEKGTLRSFQEIERKNFPTENRNRPSPLCIKFSDLRDSLKHEGFPYDFFRHCETKKINKIVITHDPKKFRYQTISETQGSPYDLSRYCETKKIDKIVIPLLSKHFLIRESF